ncbi:hypothetical protein GFK18_20350, partial [Salmonella enterica subsp. enterica serovar Enteritidis]|nr:hypothetical protein [Salmonella enterica subsp. enterica serovar Enteritidis]
GKTMFIDKTASGVSTLINEDAAAAKKSTANPLASIDSALSKVDAVRSSLGAIQNRFDSAPFTVILLSPLTALFASKSESFALSFLVLSSKVN